MALAAGFGIYAYRSEIASLAPGQQIAFNPAVVESGRLVASAGFCAECHTVPGHLPLETGFGVIYGPNLTPDAETGIGLWSEAAFLRAMKNGVDSKGRHLFPAFPYDHFTKMTEDNIRAVYAYLMTEVKPVSSRTPDTTLRFPLNLRPLQAGWKLLFVDFGTYQPDGRKSAQWNRGAYLVEGVSHCGACHTPGNALGAEDKDKAQQGAIIDRWVAPVPAP